MTNIGERKIEELVSCWGILFSEMKFSIVLLSCVILIVSAASLKNDFQVSKVRASVPEQILRCMQKFNLLRCLKYFLLFRLELSKTLNVKDLNSKNFFEVVLSKTEEMTSDDFPEKFNNYSDDELNGNLTEKIQSYFKDQPITLKFIPDFIVKIDPANSENGEIEIALRRDAYLGAPLKSAARSSKITSSEEASSGEPEHDGDDDEHHKQMTRRKGSYLHLGIPFVLTPIMIFFGFLPFLIPVLKLATAVTSIINLTALIASLFYFGEIRLNNV